jgi:hypothetical protein
VSHNVRDEGVAGSNPATPTTFLTVESVTGNDMGDETLGSLGTARRQPRPRWRDEPRNLRFISCS